MSIHHRTCRLALLTGQMSLWPVDVPEPDEVSAVLPLPAPGVEADPPSTRRRRTPSFVCEVPLQVGPAQERVLQARLEAARALYNACLGEGSPEPVAAGQAIARISACPEAAPAHPRADRSVQISPSRPWVHRCGAAGLCQGVSACLSLDRGAARCAGEPEASHPRLPGSAADGAGPGQAGAVQGHAAAGHRRGQEQRDWAGLAQ